MAAISIDWSDIENFSASEFSHVDLNHLSCEVIYELQYFRDVLGHKVFPSPVPKAWCRYDGSKTSQHYAVDRLGTAGGVFPDCYIGEALLAALRTNFGGIGIYLDTFYNGEPKPLIHLDLRPISQQAIWFAETINGERVYTTFYPHKNPTVLREIFKKLSEVE